MKPFYHFTGPKDVCYCGSGHIYKDCCFRSDLLGFIGAVALVVLSLFLPAGGWVLRMVWAIGGVVLWFCVFQRIREWFAKRRTNAGQHSENENHVA